MKEYIQESLKKGHIRPSTSPLGAGFFFVGKKDGGLRPCVDYRGLNDITRKNRYPLPLISDLFNQIQGARWFSKLDLRGAYNLIRIRQGDEWKTAFITPEGQFECLVMPFGLCNAPAVFQNFVDDLFKQLIGRCLIVYLDDILVFSPDMQSHIHHLRSVLKILHDNRLFAKKEKCVFGVQTITFLGHVITPQAITMDPDKVKAVADWVQPTSLKALQRFLGFSNYYRRFICNFSVVAKPLTDLTRRGADVTRWNKKAIEAFETLKRAFIKAPRGLETLPPHRTYDCAIDLLPDRKFPKGRMFNLTVPERQAMKEYIQESLKKGHIRPSTSPLGAGFFFVGKKDGGLRPCVDYRGLNDITRKNRYPLPLISDLFNQIQGARWFSKLDLRGAYNLIRIRQGDEWKTAFITPEGQFECLVMPFGLCNAPAVFQNFVDDLFKQLIGRCLIVYLDDILVFSPDMQSHIHHLRSVLKILHDNRLFAKKEKCVFGVQTITFLGHVITPQAITMDPDKVKAVADWVQPTSLKALQRFLGFSNYYRRFICNFSVVAKPLTDLTRRGADVTRWNKKAIEAFETLKRAFIKAPRGLETLPPHRTYDCAIDLLPDRKFPKGRMFNLTVPERQAMKEYIQESLKKGHIRPSTSPLGAGFFFVGKKDGGLRPCVDYRGLNDITRKNRYPLPLISDLFNQIQGARWFSKLDLRGAYNLIRIRQGDEWKTAFITPEGQFECLVMPFGLCNAPAVFQNFVDDLFKQLIGRCLIVYLDDILVFSPDMQSHIHHLRSVLKILHDNRLFAKKEKCVFGVQTITFLGHVITPQAITMDPDKVKAVADWVQPTSLKALQRFLGFSNYYRRFICNFSVVAKPLTDLTRRGADVTRWNKKAIEAFETLKRAF
ncbi:multicellular organism development, partial [Pristimantis euphronides]